MSKSKLTLLIDGNWLLMSRLSAISNIYVDDFEMCEKLQLLMVQSIKKIIKKFPQIDNIIFCSDNGSWRTTIDIPSVNIDEDGNIVTYKGNREKSSEINWEAVFGMYENLINQLNQNGIITFKEHLVEGDDLLYWCSDQLNKNGTNCIIWSKDNDLKQLVNIDSNKCFTVWWNETSGMFVKDFKEDDLDFLFNNDYNENDEIFRLITNNITITKLDKNYIIIDKIIRGDKGDNIMPVLYKQNPKSTRKYRISQSDINYQMDWTNDNEVLQYFTNLLNQKKYKDNVNKSLEDIMAHFIYNRRLVALDVRYYPKEIVESLNNLSFDKTSNIEGLYIVENNIRMNINNLNGIIDFV